MKKAIYFVLALVISVSAASSPVFAQAFNVDNTTVPKSSNVDNVTVPASKGVDNVDVPPSKGVDNVSKNTGGTFYLQNPLNKQFNTVGGLVSGFLQIFTYLVIIAGVLMIIYVGLRFVLAMGNPEEIKKRRDQLLWLVVGIAIVIGARIIVMVVLNTLKATDTVSPNVINSAYDAVNQTR
jgi:uncharacterized membrane protein